MAVSPSSHLIALLPNPNHHHHLSRPTLADPSNESHLFCCSRSYYPLMNNRRRLACRIAAIDSVSAAADLSRTDDLSWQIVVGAIAGVTPFVVAEIEFSKRIIAQGTCEACGGSSLVLREKFYVRCPVCGGFLPLHSWKRFFSG